MSKGPGTIQRLILDAIHDGGIFEPAPDAKVYPLLYIAHAAGYDVTKLSVRQSFTRAARKLDDSGEVNLWTLPAYTGQKNATGGTSVNREVMCVSHPDHYDRLIGESEQPVGELWSPLIRTDWDAAKAMCFVLFEDITDPMRGLRRNFAPVSAP